MQSDNPFDQSMNCFTKAERVTSESNNNVNYMLIRSLSMHPSGFYAANKANNISNGCPKWATRMLCHVLTPQKNVRRWGYIKKPKSDLTETQKRHIVLVMKQFNLDFVLQKKNLRQKLLLGIPIKLKLHLSASLEKLEV